MPNVRGEFMKFNDEYDADEILRENEDLEDEFETEEEEIDELDFESGRKNSYDELVSDLDEPNDLIE